jgi:chaperonin GroES
MKFRPLYDRVLVRRIDAEVKKGALFIPMNAQEKPLEGVVLAKGEGQLQRDGNLRPLTVKLEDRVAFSQHAGDPITLNGEEFLLLREGEISGIIN